MSRRAYHPLKNPTGLCPVGSIRLLCFCGGAVVSMSNLFSDREAEAIDFLRRYEPVMGFYLAFSGGKDSVVLHDVAKKSGVKFETHFHNTTIEAPETYRFVAQHFPDAIWDKPRMTIDRKS